MYKRCLMAAACGAVVVLAFAGSPQAEERRAAKTFAHQGHMEPAKTRYKGKRATRVRGYLGRRLGFYSYNDFDVINVYGGSRTKYGSVNSYREPFSDRQSPGGPFDSGFFFDSGMGPRWNDTPYPR
jgi:hypothetical protein